jgi:hypothetical protein
MTVHVMRTAVASRPPVKLWVYLLAQRLAQGRGGEGQCVEHSLLVN